MSGFDYGYNIFGYDNSSFTILTDNVVLEAIGALDAAFKIFTNGFGGSFYATNIDVYNGSDIFRFYDYSTNGTYFSINNLWVDYIYWDVFDIYISGSPSTIIDVNGLYGDVLGDEVFYIYTVSSAGYTGVTAENIYINYVDEEFLYLSSYANSTYVNFNNFTIQDEVDDDETFYIFLNGNYSDLSFTNFYLADNDDDDVFDINDYGKINTSIYIAHGSIIDGDDDAVDIYMSGYGTTYLLIDDLYVGSALYDDAINARSSFYYPKQTYITIMNSYLDRGVYFFSITNLSIIENTTMKIRLYFTLLKRVLHGL